VSIKDHDPRDITLDDARALYDAKLKAEAEKTFLDMHQVHVITYNLNKAMNLYNLVATDIHSPFTPINIQPLIG
jgi:hypothetical protein